MSPGVRTGPTGSVALWVVFSLNVAKLAGYFKSVYGETV